MLTTFKNLCFAILILSVFGCQETDRGRINVAVTDAPFRTDLVSKANVTITKVEARQVNEAEEKYITLFEDEIELDLLELTNGVTANLVDAEVPMGSYDLVRIYVSDASIELVNGETYEIKIPSGSSSGIKIFVSPPIEVADGLSADLLLDFDVSRSFVLKGPSNSPNGFNFKPTVKGANLSTVGSLKGNVQNSLEEPLEGVEVSVYAADTLNTTTFTNASGDYMVLGLKPGEYDLIFSFDGLSSVTKESIDIVLGNSTTVNAQFD